MTIMLKITNFSVNLCYLFYRKCEGSRHH